MIFSGDLADKVLDGTKTQTRRPARGYLNGAPAPCLYVVGRTYAIQRKRGTPGLGPRVLVTSVSLVRTFPISWADAVAEGFAAHLHLRPPHAFESKWLALYGNNFPVRCWRIEFELVPTTNAQRSSPTPSLPGPTVGDSDA